MSLSLRISSHALLLARVLPRPVVPGQLVRRVALKFDPPSCSLASCSDNTTIDTTGSGCCAGVAGESYGRTGIDGTGAFAKLPVRTPGLPNIWSVMISEVADKGNAADAKCVDTDYIELFNPTGSAIAISDMILVDDKGHGHGDQLVLGATGCPQTIGVSEYVLFCKDGDAYVGDTVYAGCGFQFGVGGSDTVNLYTHIAEDGLVDSTPGCCADSDDMSYGRLSPTQPFQTMSRTPGVVNAPLAAPPPPAPGCIIMSHQDYYTSADSTASTPTSTFEATTSATFFCSAMINASKINTVIDSSALDAQFGLTGVSAYHVIVDSVGIMATSGVDAPTIASSLVQDDLTDVTGATPTCQGLEVDVTTQVLGPAATGSCFSCHM